MALGRDEEQPESPQQQQPEEPLKITNNKHRVQGITLIEHGVQPLPSVAEPLAQEIAADAAVFQLAAAVEAAEHNRRVP